VDRLPIHDALRSIEGLQGEVLAFTLIEKAVGELSDRARLLLRSAAVYEEPVPVEALAYLLGNERDVMPEIGSEVQELLNTGLIVLPLGLGAYVVHTLVRDWVQKQWNNEERLALLRSAANYWLVMNQESGSVSAILKARYYFFGAGDYEQAGEITQITWNGLLDRGYVELVLRMLSESVRTLQGPWRAAARGNLATLYQHLGDYKNARREHEAVLEQFRAIDDRANIATSLYHLGSLHQSQEEYEQARERYQQALALMRELGHRRGMANNLRGLGNLHQYQGEYKQARECYEQALELDEDSKATLLHELGTLYHDQGEYTRAREFHEQSLTLNQKQGDHKAIAGSFHELGMLHRQLRDYERARECLEQSLTNFQILGHREGIGLSLTQLGDLHYEQGEYRRSREYYEQALEIFKTLGDLANMAGSLQRLSSLHEAQGEYERERECIEQALAISER